VFYLLFVACGMCKMCVRNKPACLFRGVETGCCSYEKTLSC